MRIERLEPGDESRLATAAGLFDEPLKPHAVQRFLSDPNHHLLIAWSDEEPVGFISGVEMTHPDKGTEMFLYELSVGTPHHRQGIGSALVEALKELAREKGCYGMWVLCDEDNSAAINTYRKVGGRASRPQLFDWRFDHDLP
jgi:ribosomal protein S18 acetylase RimI-like enzyme